MADSRWFAGMVVAVLMVAVVACAIVVSRRPAHAHAPATHMRWGPSFGQTSEAMFLVQPQAGVVFLDEELYLGTLNGVRSGKSYHDAAHSMFMRNEGWWNTKSAMIYRQPLLTFIWFALRSGTVIGIGWALLAAASMFAAHMSASRFVRQLPALVAPAGLFAVYLSMLSHVTPLLYTEMWAGPLVVLAASFSVLTLWSVRIPTCRRAWPYAWIGAISALLAVQIRELALAPALVMLVALLLDCEVRRRRLWVPLVGSLGLASCLYAWHVRQVMLVSAGDTAASTGAVIQEYIVPRISFIAACLRWASGEPYVLFGVLLLCAMAAVTAFTVRSWSLRALTGGLTLGMLALMVFTGPPGVWPDGSFTGYWGYLFIPVVIAWSPLALRLLPVLRPAAACHTPVVSSAGGMGTM